jgi:hypothetical protein
MYAVSVRSRSVPGPGVGAAYVTQMLLDTLIKHKE